MNGKIIVFLAAAGCAALALAEDGKQSPPPQKTGASNSTASAKSEADFPVIGYLEKRDYVITIKSSPNGTVYSIAAKDGKILHENVSREQLKAQAPELYEVINTGLANDARLAPSTQWQLQAGSGASRFPDTLHDVPHCSSQFLH